MERIVKERYRYTPLGTLRERLGGDARTFHSALAELDIEASDCLCRKSAVTAADLTTALQTQTEILANDPLVADNLTTEDRLTQGLQIEIPDNFRAEGVLYVHIRYPEQGTQHGTKYVQRFTIRAGRNAQARIALYHHPVAAPTETAQYTVVNSLALIDAGDGAQVEVIEVAESRAIYLSSIVCRQHNDSQVKVTTIDLDNTFLRRNQFISLEQQGAECTLEGIYITDGEQHCDNYIRMHHAVPHCTSHQLFKGVAEEASHAAFTGHVYVAPGAQQTVALQENHNIVLSDQARIDTRPQLEIYADDVKCNHGATIGRLDPEAIYYMRQRGISIEAAKRLQIEGFIDEIIDRSHIDELSHLLREKVSKRLQNC